MEPPPTELPFSPLKRLLARAPVQGLLWLAGLLLGHGLVERMIALRRAVSGFVLGGWELWAYAPLLPVFVLMALSARHWQGLLGRALLLSTLTFGYLLWAGLTSQPGFGGS